jgi:hypothetical protein
MCAPAEGGYFTDTVSITNVAIGGCVIESSDCKAVVSQPLPSEHAGGYVVGQFGMVMPESDQVARYSAGCMPRSACGIHTDLHEDDISDQCRSKRLVRLKAEPQSRDAMSRVSRMILYLAQPAIP